MENLSYAITILGEGIYYCEEGDTLEKLATVFNTAKELIIKDNNLNGEVAVGDIIYIKCYKKVYAVKVGDTPKTVADRLGVNEEELFSVNKINYVYPFLKVVSDRE